MRNVRVKSVSGDGAIEVQAVLDVRRGEGLVPRGDHIFADEAGKQPVARVEADPEEFPSDDDAQTHRARYTLKLMGVAINEGDTLWAT